MSKMLVDGGASVNLMPYTTFCKPGKGLGDLIETDMMLKDFGGNASCSLARSSRHSSSLMEKGHTIYSLVVTGFTQIVVYHQPCINI